MAFDSDGEALFLEEEFANLGKEFPGLFGQFGTVEVEVNVFGHNLVDERFKASTFSFKAFGFKTGLFGSKGIRIRARLSGSSRSFGSRSFFSSGFRCRRLLLGASDKSETGETCGENDFWIFFIFDLLCLWGIYGLISS
jgi:hypothetical protein